jgi:patatin-like phospholipase/acyl hydrolase
LLQSPGAEKNVLYDPCRGVVALETLKAIENATGKKTHELFDYIAGVSTGAIMAALVGPMRMGLEEIEDYYVTMCQQLFKHPGWWWGTGRLVLSHSLYDTTVYEEMLRFHTKGLTLEQCAVDAMCPKVRCRNFIPKRGSVLTKRRSRPVKGKVQFFCSLIDVERTVSQAYLAPSSKFLGKISFSGTNVLM